MMDLIKDVIKGRCHCSKIQYELNPPTDFCSHCHCESCRRTHGAAFVTWTSVPESQFKITEGAEGLKTYESSPGITWMSCNTCMSPLFQKTHSSPGRVYITVASLTDKLDREPDSHVSYEEHVRWFKVNDGLSRHKEKASDRIN